MRVVFLLIDSLCSSLCVRQRSQAETDDEILWYERMNIYYIPASIASLIFH